MQSVLVDQVTRDVSADRAIADRVLPRTIIQLLLNSFCLLLQNRAQKLLRRARVPLR
jgi:hypothetical protein